MTGAIYGLKDPRTPWRVRYVGSTLNAMKRLNVHLLNYDKGFSHSAAMRRWFKSLKMAGVRPEFELLELAPVADLGSREDGWIVLLGSFFPLLNSQNMGRTNRPQPPDTSVVSVTTETTD